MHEKLGFLSPRESEQPYKYGATQLFFSLSLLFSCVQYFGVSIPQAVRPTSLTTDGYGIFNVRTNSGACRTHEGDSGTNNSTQQELTWRDRKNVPHPAPARESNPGSSDLNSDSLNHCTELRPPECKWTLTIRPQQRMDVG